MQMLRIYARFLWLLVFLLLLLLLLLERLVQIFSPIITTIIFPHTTCAENIAHTYAEHAQVFCVAAIRCRACLCGRAVSVFVHALARTLDLFPPFSYAHKCKRIYVGNMRHVRERTSARHTVLPLHIRNVHIRRRRPRQRGGQASVHFSRLRVSACLRSHIIY